jgi:hypothetical protein
VGRDSIERIRDGARRDAVTLTDEANRARRALGVPGHGSLWA